MLVGGIIWLIFSFIVATRSGWPLSNLGYMVGYYGALFGPGLFLALRAWKGDIVKSWGIATLKCFGLYLVACLVGDGAQAATRDENIGVLVFMVVMGGFIAYAVYRRHQRRRLEAEALEHHEQRQAVTARRLRGSVLPLVLGVLLAGCTESLTAKIDRQCREIVAIHMESMSPESQWYEMTKRQKTESCRRAMASAAMYGRGRP